MNELDPLVTSLIDLCKREGGHEYVAEKAKVSADNLWQILKGIKLPSGRPRGVGPKLRARLTMTYPGWITPKAEEVQAPHPVKKFTNTRQATNDEDSYDDRSLMAKALAKMFDDLPDDDITRAIAFGQAANQILEAGRQAQKNLQAKAPEPVRNQETQPELPRTEPI